MMDVELGLWVLSSEGFKGLLKDLGLFPECEKKTEWSWVSITLKHIQSVAQAYLLLMYWNKCSRKQTVAVKKDRLRYFSAIYDFLK